MWNITHPWGHLVLTCSMIVILVFYCEVGSGINRLCFSSLCFVNWCKKVCWYCVGNSVAFIGWHVCNLHCRKGCNVMRDTGYNTSLFLDQLNLAVFHIMWKQSNWKKIMPDKLKQFLCSGYLIMVNESKDAH